jgi:hypothetical protein
MRGRVRAAIASAGFGIAIALTGCGVSTFSTDVPLEFHDLLKQKYEGRQAWTRLTLQDEKKSTKIEQDQEVVVKELVLSRSGAVTLVTPNGRTRIVHALELDRPLVLEQYEKKLLDILWFESPDARYAGHKEKFGTRIADAIRDHKILKDMNQQVAYLAWGAPTKVTSVIKRGLDERWEYETKNLTSAKIDFRGGRVAHVEGENIADTEAAKRRSRFRN